MVVEVELLAHHLPAHVDGDNGFVVPLGSWLDEEEVAVEDEGCWDNFFSKVIGLSWVECF